MEESIKRKQGLEGWMVHVEKGIDGQEGIGERERVRARLSEGIE